jgi:hypothetical protein
MDAAQQQAIAEASRNIMLELELRRFSLDKAVASVYESSPYEITRVAEIFLEFLQTGAAIIQPSQTTGAVTNE